MYEGLGVSFIQKHSLPLGGEHEEHPVDAHARRAARKGVTHEPVLPLLRVGRKEHEVAIAPTVTAAEPGRACACMKIRNAASASAPTERREVQHAGSRHRASFTSNDIDPAALPDRGVHLYADRVAGARGADLLVVYLHAGDLTLTGSSPPSTSIVFPTSRFL